MLLNLKLLLFISLRMFKVARQIKMVIVCITMIVLLGFFENYIYFFPTVPRSLPLDISNNMATEEDYESGNGPSLPQSPSSVDGIMNKGVDSDEDDIKIFCKYVEEILPNIHHSNFNLST